MASNGNFTSKSPSPTTDNLRRLFEVNLVGTRVGDGVCNSSSLAEMEAGVEGTRSGRDASDDERFNPLWQVLGDGTTKVREYS